MDGALRAFNDFMNSGPNLWLWAVSAFVVAFPITFLHEIGHALVARRRLLGSVRVEMGLTAQRFEFSAGGIDFRISPLTSPLGYAGACIYDGQPTARDALAISLAGPFATFVGFTASIAAIPHAHGVVRELVWMAVTMQGFGLVLNLVPFTLSNGFSSDGKAALDALRHSGTRRAQRVRVETRRLEAPTTATSPPCAACGHRRDEHVDLATGRRGSCRGQHYDFQSLAAQLCDCERYIHGFSLN